MDISPQRVRTAEFKTVKRGLDPDEVRAFLNDVAAELERAQNQSTAMEARARAAVQRLQELADTAPATTGLDTTTAPPVAAPAPEPAVEAAPDVAASADQAEIISRTLILAQRTADTTVAEAEARANEITSSADEEATRTLESTREMSARLIEEAREEARRVGHAERINVEGEVNSLMARRDFLESDVDHLESFLIDQRIRLREAAAAIVDVAERVPSGLGEVRRPLLSASDDDLRGSSPVANVPRPGDTGRTPAIDPDPAPAADASAAPTIAAFDELVIATDISDEGPQPESTPRSGFSYDADRDTALDTERDTALDTAGESAGEPDDEPDGESDGSSDTARTNDIHLFDDTL